MGHRTGRCAVLLLLLIPGIVPAAEMGVRGGRIRPDDYTVVMAVDGTASEGLRPFQPGRHAKFFLQGWTRPDQEVTWTVSAGAREEYEVFVAVKGRSRTALRLEVSAAGQTVAGSAGREALRWWDRTRLEGLLALPAGAVDVTLRIRPAEGAAEFEAQVQSVELVRPAARAELERRALAMRADPTWFQEARYGIMVHWTKQSAPLHGEPKGYEQAVAEFDVESFADQAKRTGAGFVVFTTSHAHHYFPAPLAALDRILPGRTTKRDLVADLAEALNRRGMRLMLYYHLGSPSDPEWIKASGLETDTGRFFENWRAIVSEAGDRYKDKLAGWWFDDGSTGYYHRGAPWESLALAARAGNRQRLIGFNAWELINPTQFHDFCTGEGCQEPRGFGGLLIPGGDGRYPAGTHKGLQASACLITEKDWGHFTRDTPLPAPKWDAQQLAGLIRQFAACRNVPIFNLQITQEGKMSPGTVRVLEEAGAGE